MSRLHKVTFDCEVITPMFLGDSTGNKAELRVPPLKAEMRFWLRAILGGLVNQDSNKTAIIEQMIMGGIKDSSNQSNIHLRLFTKEDEVQSGDKPMLPHKSGKKSAYNNAILPESKFKVELKTFANSYKILNRKGNIVAVVSKKSMFDISLQLFELTSLIGTIGQRSNRGFGSFNIIKMNSELVGNHAIENRIKATISGLSNKLELFIRSTGIYSEFLSNFNINGGHIRVSKWPIVHSDCFKISIGNETKWDLFIESLMRNIHKELKDKKLLPKVLGGFKPRQGSTMKVSMIKAGDNVVPVFTNFICQTALKPKRKDYQNILNFPVDFHNAKVIAL